MVRAKDLIRGEGGHTSKPEMVHWYDPGQLVKTGIQVLASIIWGSRADARIILAGLREEQELFDYSDRRELWIDYVADLGDGWNATYAVAYCLAQERLSVDGHETRRGDLLIMGGDEVYPAASREEYERRLVTPYEAAFPRSEPPHPHLFALPGNHDWYDGLVSFTRLFCQKTPPRWIGGWQLPQTRSYFALKLPHGWWLLGADIQLEADIDGPQLEYFQAIAQQMAPGDRVILCTPKPDWIYGAKHTMNLDYFEQKILAPRGARVVLRLTGDLHHYRRHEHETTDGSKTHLIIAGGGGAFLHPTHGPNVDRICYGPDGACFRLAAEFPDRKTSRRLTWRNLQFPIRNLRFGILPGVAYVALSWAMPHQLYRFELPWEWHTFWIMATALVLASLLLERLKSTFVSTLVAILTFVAAVLTSILSLRLEAVKDSLCRLITIPSALVWLVMIVFTFCLFTRQDDVNESCIIHTGVFGKMRRICRTFSRGLWKWKLLRVFNVAGLAHASGHLLAALIGAWMAHRVSAHLCGLPGQSPSVGYFLTATVITFLWGWAIGSWIMGVYLFLSLNIFGQHANEAFSALRIEDYKNFLRLHLDASGRLTIYPIGIEKVPRKWASSHQGGGSRYVPFDGKIECHLIENPIEIRAAQRNGPCRPWTIRHEARDDEAP
ncbi:hypothetical protein HRbin08_01697 [bacterium HR08]|nr:hypothetical protein HRbin08_01697 [bacterium HR08]